MENLREYRHPVSIGDYTGSEADYMRAMAPVTQLVTLLHLGRVDRQQHPFFTAHGTVASADGSGGYEKVRNAADNIATNITLHMTQTAVEVVPILQPILKTGLHQEFAALRDDPQTIAWLEDADRKGNAVERGERASMMIASGIKVGVRALVDFSILRHHPSGSGRSMDPVRLGQVVSGTDSIGLTLALNEVSLSSILGPDQILDPDGREGVTKRYMANVAVRGAPGCPARKAVHKEVVALLEKHGFAISEDLRRTSPIQSLGKRIRELVDDLLTDGGTRSPS